MWVTRTDASIVNSKEVWKLREAYSNMFDEFFPNFNYADFKATEGKCAGQVYKEALEEALKSGKPYHIMSHRYDFIDH